MILARVFFLTSSHETVFDVGQFSVTGDICRNRSEAQWVLYVLWREGHSSGNAHAPIAQHTSECSW